MHAPETSVSNSSNYRSDIDGLRAVAVMSVVVFHAFPGEGWLTGGFIGVDVFFVISGYLISKILFSEIETHRFSIAAFYARRIRRIFPALAICLAVTLAYGFVVLMPSELAQLGKHVFFGASFLANLALWSESGYFDIAASSKPLLHLWSLGVEEQFYIVWPLLLWLTFRLKATGRTIAGVFTASFVANVVLSINDISSAFYLPVSRFWELLAGAALARRPDVILNQNIRNWASLAGFAAIIASAVLFTADMRFPGWLALLPVAGTAALIASGPDAIFNRTILSHRTAVWIGLISYPLYLWHWPLISFSYVIRGKPPTILLATAMVIASVLLAWMTYRFIELPIRFGSNRRKRTWITALCVAAIGTCGLAVWASGGVPQRFPADLDLQKINAATLDETYAATKDMKVLEFNGCTGGSGCLLGLRHGYPMVSQIGSGDRGVALVGNSSMFHYGPRLQQLADDGLLAVEAYFVTGPGCSAVPGVISRDEFVTCANVTKKVDDLVQQQKLQSVVLGPHYWPRKNAFIEREGQSIPLDGSEIGRQAFYANLEDYVRKLTRRTQVYLLLGAPQSPSRLNPTQMLITRTALGFRIDANFETPIKVTDLRSVYAPHDEALRMIAGRTGPLILDSFPDVCGAGPYCSPFFGDREPKFTDGAHLRPMFVREHIHFLDALLMRQ